MSRVEELVNTKRPSTAFIKLIEAVGIVLRIPRRAIKSKYKAPTPSNYDETAEYLADNFYDSLIFLAALQSSGIPNDIAAELYAKTLEPGFDYEAALNSGGLVIRELFNSIILIIQSLQSDDFRIPVAESNVLIVMDGSRSSYVAFDYGVHMFQHGKLTIAALKIWDRITPNEEKLMNHIPGDLVRRCKNQYKLPDYAYGVVPLECNTLTDTVDAVRECYQQNQCQTLVIGVDANHSESDYLTEVVSWAAWDTKIRLVLAKSYANVSPFSNISMNRKFVICVKNLDDLGVIFAKALVLIKSSDDVILYSVAESNKAQGNLRETRHGFGERAGWVQGAKPPSKWLDEAAFAGWNDETLNVLETNMNKLIEKSQIRGEARIDFRRKGWTVAQHIREVCFTDQVNVAVMYRGEENDVSSECVRDLPTNIVLVS
jgi:hypothetical protein